MLVQPKVKRLLSSDHFSVDGTLIEAWAELARGHAKRSLVGWPAEGSMKSFRPKESGKDGELPFFRRPQRRCRFQGAEALQRDAREHDRSRGAALPQGIGMEAKLCFMGHALMENRSGLIVDTCLTAADGHAERVAALAMIEPRADRPGAVTLGMDKAYDAEDFVNDLRSMNVRAHVAQNTNGRRSAIGQADDPPSGL